MGLTLDMFVTVADADCYWDHTPGTPSSSVSYKLCVFLSSRESEDDSGGGDTNHTGSLWRPKELTL